MRERCVYFPTLGFCLTVVSAFVSMNLATAYAPIDRLSAVLCFSCNFSHHFLNSLLAINAGEVLKITHTCIKILSCSANQLQNFENKVVHVRLFLHHNSRVNADDIF
jgi:hypothetical protein